MAEKTTFSALPSCQQCIYFDSTTDLIAGRTVHICRFKPPVPVALQGMTAQGPTIMNGTLWPQVTASDWCGEHRSREQ
jgi:hypothetical protein